MTTCISPYPCLSPCLCLSLPVCLSVCLFLSVSLTITVSLLCGIAFSPSSHCSISIPCRCLSLSMAISLSPSVAVSLHCRCPPLPLQLSLLVSIYLSTCLSVCLSLSFSFYPLQLPSPATGSLSFCSCISPCRYLPLPCSRISLLNCCCPVRLSLRHCPCLSLSAASCLYLCLSLPAFLYHCHCLSPLQSITCLSLQSLLLSRFLSVAPCGVLPCLLQSLSLSLFLSPSHGLLLLPPGDELIKRRNDLWPSEAPPVHQSILSCLRCQTCTYNILGNVNGMIFLKLSHCTSTGKLNCNHQGEIVCSLIELIS